MLRANHLAFSLSLPVWIAFYSKKVSSLNVGIPTDILQDKYEGFPM